MNEEFLHYIWKTRFEKKTITAVKGEKITIVKAGEQNRDSGPDFFNAMLRIGDTTWAGSVEVHVRSSDWAKHGHDRDQAYDNVVLHAVYEYDAPVFRPSGEEIPAVELKGHIPEKAYAAYLDFLNNHLWIPCAGEIGGAGMAFSGQHLEKLCRERINKRALQIRQLLSENKGDWNQAFFESLAGTLGTRINKEPFEMLARNTPVQLILKTRSSLTALEALLFGQAGFLQNGFTEEYPNLLGIEYQHLKRKYNLTNMPVHLWKFLRLRPVNFPTVRIAQLAAIYHHHPLPFGTIIDNNSPEKWYELFNVSVSEYWKTHYHFDTLSGRNEKRTGQDTLDLILINTVIPFIYCFGLVHGNGESAESAFKTLSSLAPENNSIIRNFNYFGMELSNAMQTQGALELKKHWCDQRRCLDCGIGQELLKKVF
jgi:hypothetical protein